MMRAIVAALLCWLCVAGACAEEGPSFTGVDVRDVATRHYYNPFDGLLLDRNPYPAELTDDAEQLVAHLADGGGAALGVGTLSSARVMGWSPGRLDVLAIGLPGPRF